MKNMKKYIALFVCAFALVATVGVSRTNAYFTARTEAAGTLKVKGYGELEVHPQEAQGANGEKVITVENTGDADCWVRVKVVHPSTVEVNVEPTVPNDPNWKNVGDYWYYTKILPAPAEGKTSVTETSIEASVEIINGQLKDILPEFKVVVVTECIPVLDYEATEPPIDADGWAQEFKIVEEG